MIFAKIMHSCSIISQLGSKILVQYWYGVTRKGDSPIIFMFLLFSPGIVERQNFAFSWYNFQLISFFT